MNHKDFRTLAAAAMMGHKQDSYDILCERFDAALSALNEREKAVLIGRFVDGHTLRAVGNQIQRCPERVRIIEMTAMRKLLRRMRALVVIEDFRSDLD